jgi:hypothetical protein
MDPWRLEFDAPRAQADPAGLRFAIAHDQRMVILVAQVAEVLEILLSICTR